MQLSPRIKGLIQALTCFPGVGSKSAQRMALYLLERDRQAGRALVDALNQALDSVGYCHSCRMLSETPLCPICADETRDASLLCIVESPSDVIAIENIGQYRGRYFVLMGRLSPLDGMGPDEIGLPQLLSLLGKGEVREVIMATNPNVEGEATAQFIADKVKAMQIEVSRIAYGVPMGGELEYVDGGTLTEALLRRQPVA